MATLSVETNGLPYRPLVKPRIVWLAAAAWGPALGPLDALLDGGATMASRLGQASCWAILFCAIFAARYAVAAPTRTRAIKRTSVGVLAGLAVGLALFAAPPGANDSALIGAAFVLAALLAVSWNSLLVFALYPALRSSGHELSERALALAAAWVALPNALLGIVALAGHGGGSHVPYSVDARVLLGCFVPIVVGAFAIIRIILRRRWLRQVADGRVAGWKLLAIEPSFNHRLPVLVGHFGETPQILARVRNSGEPFRDHGLEEVALVGSARAGADG